MSLIRITGHGKSDGGLTEGWVASFPSLSHLQLQELCLLGMGSCSDTQGSEEIARS